MECSEFDPLEQPNLLYTRIHPDPATGICGPCKAPGCHRCALEDATRCDSDLYMAGDGCMEAFYFNETDAQCYPCTAVGCASCSPDAPDQCTGIFCIDGYWWDETEEACKPCISGCDVCDLFKGEQCERCADGYFLEMDSKLCKSVSTWKERGYLRQLQSVAPCELLHPVPSVVQCSEPAGSSHATCALPNRGSNT